MAEIILKIGHDVAGNMPGKKYNPIPVIIGAGQVNDRDEPGKASLGLDSLGLMEAALRTAMREAGGCRGSTPWASSIKFPSPNSAMSPRLWRRASERRRAFVTSPAMPAATARCCC